MYICRNCGMQYMSDEAVMCTRCQAPKGEGSQFCPCCGIPTKQPMQTVCLNCGVDMTGFGNTSPKSKIAAGVLGLFLGLFGAHNFYLGYTKKAVIQLLLTISAYILYFVGIIGAAISETSYYNSEAIVVFAVIAIIYFLLAVCGVGIWVFVESIMIFCGKIKKDGKGRMLK